MSLTSQQYAALTRDGYDKPEDTGERSAVVNIGGLPVRRLQYVDKPSGYQGVIYERADTREIVVVHRGSEFDRQPLLDGALADGGMVATRHNAQISDAIALTQKALKYAEQKHLSTGLPMPDVTVAGHSLGGNLAQVTAHHFGLKGQTFDAYGAVSLDRRIPEGGSDVINHVMAGDAVSAASRHYGQVKVYATPQEIAVLRAADYANDRSALDARDPLSAAVRLGESHRMHNFLPVDGAGKADTSVLEDPSTQQLARQYAPMIEKYRGDIETLRSGLTVYSRGIPGMARDGVDHLRGTLEPGTGRREMDTPTWRQQMQQFQHDRERSHVPQAWQVPLKGDVQGAPAIASTHRSSAPTLHDDPGAFLDRMLAAAKSGDRDQFRQMTQTLANEPSGRALRADAIEVVNQQEQQAAQQTMHAQRRQADLQQQETMRVGARSL
ncbi:lipase [Xanthomonas prunicola]|uniref:Lipase n=1 Tax=Xanthomonas prunicola TaxID=2053930 RepID=A0A9Q9J2A7_9XANT|nr:lipase [Xanthomonas prunicola]USI99532.1 lipase [Xanthomonas prunicola]UXA47983.1 lipase [Xanthomonas prunicola]UXA56447.1 lipase [Xanthomonas prunicola]UXA62404.1 lipase [Xanthomonas prunicola]UXA64606.1 lipase [Xanthomonas prunicola]